MFELPKKEKCISLRNQFDTYKKGEHSKYMPNRELPYFRNVMEWEKITPSGKKEGMNMEYPISVESIASKILFIRGEKVILDRDLAVMYGVTTKVLNQAVKRNIKRFPHDFMFFLSEDEKKELVTNCDRFNSMRI
jgi:hypothetical protein